MIVVDYCDFGELGVCMGLGVDIGWFLFCFRGFFGLFSVVLRPWFYIVVLRLI